MDKAALASKLDVLKSKSDEIISQITSHEEAIKSLTEEALIIKGKYQATEELANELDAAPKSKKGK